VKRGTDERFSAAYKSLQTDGGNPHPTLGRPAPGLRERISRDGDRTGHSGGTEDCGVAIGIQASQGNDPEG
jgi:hypothetical protein